MAHLIIMHFAYTTHITVNENRQYIARQQIVYNADEGYVLRSFCSW